MGEIAEIQDKPDKTLAFYERALALNPKVGLKRKVAAMKATRPYCEAEHAQSLGAPPPLPPRPAGWGNEADSHQCDLRHQSLSPGQIQFLKKIRDRPLSKEDIEYYKQHDYYRDLVDGDLGEFIDRLGLDGYIRRSDSTFEAWTCTAKGIVAVESLVIEARSNPAIVKSALGGLNASEILKIATELKRDGNLIGAVEALKLAYTKIGESSTTYGIDTFLRLPSYLQMAGRNDEAWEYLNRLLTSGYPNQLSNMALNIRDKSLVYSSMSRFLHKEGKHRQAVVLKTLSLISRAHVHHLRAIEYCRSSESELRKDSQSAFLLASGSEVILEALASSIPKNARLLDLNEVVEHACELLKEPDQIKYDLAYIDIDKILSRQNHVIG
jgi:hypothetical protein